MDPASVVVAEPHEPCRRALATLIAGTEGQLSFAGAATTLPEAVELASRVSPDLILLGLAERIEYQAIREVKARVPDTGIVVLALEEDSQAVLEALREGASGYVPKWAEPDELVDTLVRVAQGEVAVHPAVALSAIRWAAEQLDDERHEADRTAVHSLTPREHEILGLLASGRAPQAIARELFISRRTVESHLAHVYRKLGVRRQIDAVRTYLKTTQPVAADDVSDTG